MSGQGYPQQPDPNFTPPAHPVPSPHPLYHQDIHQQHFSQQHPYATHPYNTPQQPYPQQPQPGYDLQSLPDPNLSPSQYYHNPHPSHLNSPGVPAQHHQLGGPVPHPYAAAFLPQQGFPVAQNQYHQQQHHQQPQPGVSPSWAPQQLQQLQLQQQPQQQQQQQHLQQPKQELPEPIAVQPSPPQAAPYVAPVQPPPEQPIVSPHVPKITLRFTNKPKTAPVAADADMPMPTRGTRNASAAAAVPTPADDDEHSRPRRRASKPIKYADDDDDEDFVGTPETPPRAASRKTGDRRATRQSSRAVKEEDYEEEEEDDDGDFDAEGDGDGDGDDDFVAPAPATHETRRSRRAHKAPERYDDDDFENKMMDTSPIVEPVQPVATTSTSRPAAGGRPKRRGAYQDPDDDEDATPVPSAAPPAANGDAVDPAEADYVPEPPKSQSRGPRHSSADAESFAPSESADSASSPDPIGDDYVDDDVQSFAESSPPRRRTTRQTTVARRSERTRRRQEESDEEYGARRTLRKRDAQVNYALPPLDMTAEIQAAERQADMINRMAGGGGRNRGFGGMTAAGKPLPWSMRGKDLANLMGDADSSDSDADLPMNAAAGPSRAGPAGPNVPGPSDVPNFGRFNPKSSTADADPLGVDVNVTFDRVGGLDNHINQLKEMVALPLLYPELFQQFGITPPRGVLFHGPPGTGKTLLARALAASCSNGNTKIAFFMRKGADVLSKWVGEAERQLRMLFEEARASQPSIIFFDEIDGLAPVRSSKQDQIHASLVSTLLALMDGMDGRGQVIVIGATNRPDAVDPALRRPGRFDREFYFPLPNRDARRKIIGINTRDWEPQLPDSMLDNLATLTKGYGGADLRALCTESALNAIQRRYPQIYKSTDRLLVQPGSIHVQPKDFMLAVKKIIPSSARSTSSTAIQLPAQLTPLLSNDLERLKTAVDRAMPPVKKRTALEEAEYEDEDGDTFEKEMMLQSLDKLRTYRPRLVVYGAAGSGQTYLGPAILHHLEGFHVQSFDLASLMSDSTRTVEAGIVQLFVEAKRHQPSIIFIPSLAQWAANVTETARSTTRALLDGIPPSDPVLLLALVDGPLNTLPRDVRSWFGFGDENRLELGTPSADQRAQFFSELLDAVHRRPIDFPDGVPRKKRVLEELPIAPPLPPREPTHAEIQRELDRDNAARHMIQLSFNTFLGELKRKYQRPVLMAKEAAYYAQERAAAEKANANGNPEDPAAEAPQIVVDPATGQTGVPVLIDNGDSASLAVEPPRVEIVPVLEVATARTSVEPASNPEIPTIVAHDLDLETMSSKLIKHKYCTPAEVLHDLALIEENSRFLASQETRLKIGAMMAQAQIHVSGFDAKWTPEFEAYAHRTQERKAKRRAEREKAKAERDKADAERAEAAAKDKDTEGTNGDAQPVVTENANGNGDGDATPTANGLKRTREDGDSGEGEPAEKRPRDDAMDVDPIDSIENGTEPAAPEPAVSAPNTQPAVGTPKDKEPTPPAAAPTDPTPPAAPKEPTPPAKESTPTPTPKEATPVPPRTPTPPPVYPPFVVPEDDVSQLTTALRDVTAPLNVEELEQLRASLLDCVWRARQDWDRTHLVTDMRARVAKFVREVMEVRDDGEDEF